MKSTHDPIRGVLNTIHGVCLALACGVVIATGVAAAVAFPTMRDLDPTLADLASVDDHWMIAAGSVMARVFVVTAVIAGGAIAVSVVAFLMHFLREKRRGLGATAVRLLTLAALVAVFTHYSASLLPDMNNTFNDFVSAAREGDGDRAAALRAEFDAHHPVASRELSAIAALSLVAALLSAWPLHRRGRSTR